MRNERGMALVIVLIVAVLLSLLCLSLTFSSLKEFQISTEFENHEKALLIADAGYNAERQGLRGHNLDTLLSTETTITVYMPDPAADAYAVRNPLSPIDARNIDFSRMPTGGTSIRVKGLLTPATGVEIPESTAGAGVRGRYFARLMDDDDEKTVANDRTKDLNGTVYLRVIGVYSNLPGEGSAYNSSRKNAVATIEAELHRDKTFDMTAPLSLISKQVAAIFDGNSFTIDGYDHTGMSIKDLETGNHTETGKAFSGISCLYDNPGLGDASAAENNVKTALKDNQDKNIIGDGTPAVNDDTLDVWKSGNPDSTNVFNPNFLLTIATQLGSIADYSFPTGTDTSTKFSGGEVYGTLADPKITYVKGNLDIAGNCTGAGILVVTGDMSGNGGFEFQGLVLVLGTGKLSFAGANKILLGGIVVANLVSGTPPTFGTANIDIRGKSDFYFAGDKIRMATMLLPMRTRSWREITPEVEPMAAQQTP